MTATTLGGQQSPSDFLALTEAPRAIFEFASFMALRPAMSFLPRGDGHPVLVLPGFMASDSSTIPLRNLLVDLGYDAVGWELGRNIQITEARIQGMSRCLTELYERTGRKVSLIGWSLGGVLVRELAKRHPEMVRQVISLGSPLRADSGQGRVRRLFEALNGTVPDIQRRSRSFADMDAAPPVPATSVYTKSDGIVHWTGSLQTEDTFHENVEVYASHCGLGVNPGVMWVIADRLAQDEGEWAPFEAKGCAAWAFPTKQAVH